MPALSVTVADVGVRSASGKVRADTAGATIPHAKVLYKDPTDTKTQNR